jgi:hypothetical protein
MIAAVRGLFITVSCDAMTPTVIYNHFTGTI